MKKQKQLIYKIKSKDDYVSQREINLNQKNQFLVKLTGSREEKLYKLINTLKLQGWSFKTRD